MTSQRMAIGNTNSKCFFLFYVVTLCFLFLAQICWSDKTTANSTKCADLDVKVYAKTIEDIPFICSAAQNTYSFLTKAGFKNRFPIEIYVVEDIKELPSSNHYMGMYDKRLKRVTILSHNSFIKHFRDLEFCGVRFSRELHSGLVVHEIAHAIAHANMNDKISTIAAEEYIAYTTQFALLPDEIRSKILTRIPNEGFSNEREITSLFYQLNPRVFAVKAYRHFLRPENGKRFYNKLISGQCILDSGD